MFSLALCLMRIADVKFGSQMVHEVQYLTFIVFFYPIQPVTAGTSRDSCPARDTIKETPCMCTCL